MPCDLSSLLGTSGTARPKLPVPERYYPGVYYERNRMMIDHSSELICYHDGGRGGTTQTVRYARSKGISIYNLLPESNFI